MFCCSELEVTSGKEKSLPHVVPDLTSSELKTHMSVRRPAIVLFLENLMKSWDWQISADSLKISYISEVITQRYLSSMHTMKAFFFEMMCIRIDLYDKDKILLKNGWEKLISYWLLVNQPFCEFVKNLT